MQPAKEFSIGGILILMTSPEFRRGEEAWCHVVAWESFKLPRKVVGSNGVEAQVFSIAEEALWLARISWAVLHGVPLVRRRLHDAAQAIPGALVSDSRGIYDGARKRESPQKGLRSSKTCMELEQCCEDALRSGAVLRWNHGGAMLADTLTKRSPVAGRKENV